MHTPPLQFFIDLERRVWNALQQADRAADEALLSENFLGVYQDGFAARQAHVAQCDLGPSILQYALADSRLMVLAQDTVLLAYRATFKRSEDSAEESMYVSSIWQQQADVWRNVFSQDTPALA